MFIIILGKYFLNDIYLYSKNNNLQINLQIKEYNLPKHY
jgi:hypothetical protein